MELLLKPLWIPTLLNGIPDTLSRIPILREQFFPEIYLKSYVAGILIDKLLAIKNLRLWPSVTNMPIPFNLSIPLASALDFTSKETIFLLAPPSGQTLKILRFIIDKRICSLVCLPIWRNMNWWQITEHARLIFTIQSNISFDNHPYVLFLFNNY